MNVEARSIESVAKEVEATRSAVNLALADTREVDLSWITPPPTDDGWTLAADALRFLFRILCYLSPKHVVEFGSGVSTQMMLRARQGMRVTSIDHDPEFALDVNVLPEHRDAVSLQIAPIVARDFGGKLLPQYFLDERKFACPVPADLVLIDGPPVTLGGREGALYQAIRYSRPGSLLLLDDADRQSERVALSHICDNLPEAVELRMLPGFSKGMAALIVREVVDVSRLWQLKLNRASQWLNRAIPATTKFVLVGYMDRPGRSGHTPLVVQNGEIWEAPLNDDHAATHLERCRSEGADYFVVMWSAFWWLDYYIHFFTDIRKRFRCVLENDQMIVFDIKKAGR